MTHVVTVWWRRGGVKRKEIFAPVPHVRSNAIDGGWEIEFCDEEWEVLSVEQFRRVDRVSIRREPARERSQVIHDDPDGRVCCDGARPRDAERRSEATPQKDLPRDPYDSMKGGISDAQEWSNPS